MEDVSQFGPLMGALTEKQRGYVLAMLSDPLGNPTLWARAAGYSDHLAQAKVRGHYLAHDERMKEAAREEARRHLDTIGPVLGIGVMFQIARTKGHKKQLEAAVALANRAGFHEKTEHQVSVRHSVDERDLERLATQLAAELGVDAARLLGGPASDGEAKRDKAPVTIEGEVVHDEGRAAAGDDHAG